VVLAHLNSFVKYYFVQKNIAIRHVFVNEKRPRFPEGGLF
jgi:hypothetical protein